MGDANIHLQAAMLELIKGRTRLVKLDREQHRAQIAESDSQLRTLLQILCPDHVRLFAVDVEHTAIEELFPVEHAESAQSFACVNLWLGRRWVSGTAWRRADNARRYRDAANDAADAGDTP